MAEQQQDWFSQNAPQGNTGSDWFTQNSPSTQPANKMAFTDQSGQTQWVSRDPASLKSAVDKGWKVGSSSQGNIGGTGRPEEINPALQTIHEQAQPSAANRYAYNTLRPFYMGDPEHGRGPLDQLGYEAKQLVTHPVDMAVQTVTAPVKAYKSSVQTAFANSKAAADKGDVNAAVAHAVSGFIPLIGGQSSEAIDQIQKGDYAGAAGTLSNIGLQGTMASPEVNEAAASALPKVADIAKNVITKTGEIVKPAADLARNNPITDLAIGPNPEAIPADAAFIKATKPRNSIQDINEHVNRGLPDARRAADNLGIDTNNMSLRDAENAVSQAKKDVWDEFTQNHLDPNAHVVMDTSEVGDAINAVGNKMSPIQQRRLPSIVNEIKDNAADYSGQQMTVGQIEDRIQELNNELRSQQSTFKVNEMNLRRDPNYAHKFAEIDALRDLENQAVGGMDSPDAAALKQRYGSLKVLQDVLDRRINVAERQNPVGLYEGMGRGAGFAKMAQGGVQTLLLNPKEGLSNIAEGAALATRGANLQKLNNPDFLIQQAFSKTTPREAPTINPQQGASNIPPAVPPRGLLPSGPIELPSSQEPIDQGPQGLLPAQNIVARDPKTGKMKTFYGSGTGPTIYQNATNAPKTASATMGPEEAFLRANGKTFFPGADDQWVARNQLRQEGNAHPTLDQVIERGREVTLDRVHLEHEARINGKLTGQPEILDPEDTFDGRDFDPNEPSPNFREDIVVPKSSSQAGGSGTAAGAAADNQDLAQARQNLGLSPGQFDSRLLSEAQKIKDARLAQGGHAGGGVSSVEELNRPGQNYVVSKGGNISFQGKSFAPEGTPSGASHVTVMRKPSTAQSAVDTVSLGNGYVYRVNSGQRLTPMQEAALRRALNEK